VIEPMFRITHIHPSQQWFFVPPKDDIQWGLFLSSVLWVYAGWDSLGTYAGEVKDPKRTYPRAIAIALLMNIVIYLVAIIVGLTYVSNDLSQWVEGFFDDIANYIAAWLGIWVIIGATICNFGTYNTNISAISRALWAMGQGENQSVPSIFSWTWKRYNTPVVGVIFTSLAVCALLPFNFSQIVQCDSFMGCIGCYFEFSAFMWLKYKDPSPRPFVVPGGKIGAWFITLLIFPVITLTIILSAVETFLIVGIIWVGILIIYGTKVGVRKFLQKRKKNQEEADPLLNTSIQ